MGPTVVSDRCCTYAHIALHQSFMKLHMDTRGGGALGDINHLDKC